MESSLQSLQADIWRQYHRDGRTEFLFVFGYLWAGLYMGNSGQFGFVGLIPVMILLLQRAWLKRITYPRLGYADIVGRNRPQAIRRRRWVLAAALVLLVAIVIFTALWKPNPAAPDPFTRHGTQIGIGALLGAIAFALAAVRHAPSLYLIGIVLVVGVALAGESRASIGDVIAVCGMLMMLIGIVRAILFIRRNPVVDSSLSN